MNSYWLVYHPKREEIKIDGVKIYYDSFIGNQDPFIWNKKFLHSYCHMTELNKVKEGDVIFWVSSDGLKKMTEIKCDLVFKVEKIIEWKHMNPDRNDEMEEVLNQFKGDLSDKQSSYENHFRWYFDGTHAYKEIKSNGAKSSFKRRTFIATEKSYQPQDENGNLLDIKSILEAHIDLDKLKHPSGRGSFRTEIRASLADKLENYFGDTELKHKKFYGEKFYEISRSNISKDDSYIEELGKYYVRRREYLKNRMDYIGKLKNEKLKETYRKKYCEDIDYYLEDIIKKIY